MIASRPAGSDRARSSDNHLTIRRDEVEARVLRALQDKLLRQDLFQEFCDEFTREMNRLRMEYRAGLSAAEPEIEGQRTIPRLIVRRRSRSPRSRRTSSRRSWSR